MLGFSRRLRLFPLADSRDFRNLWAGQSLSLVGSQVTLLALPLAAVITLKASALQVGILQAAEYTPFLLFGLIAGVWVDRLPRRPLMIASEWGRAGFLITIPPVAALGLLRIEHLYVVSFLVGLFTLVFDVSHSSFLPLLVRREDLPEAYSRLETSRTIAQVAGPSIAGGLVQLVTAPIAIAVDAFSFIWSAWMLSHIRTAEPPRPALAERRGVLKEAGDGLRIVAGHALLRPVVSTLVLINFSLIMLAAVYVLYLTRDLRMTPMLIGLMFATSGTAGISGAMLSGRLARRFGIGAVLTGMVALCVGGGLLIPSAGLLPHWPAVVLVALGHAVFSFAAPVVSVNQASLRQAITPDHLRGRVTATARWATRGLNPVAALLGGVLGGRLGLQATLYIAAGGLALALATLALSPVRSLRSLPARQSPPVSTPPTPVLA